jgi:ATP-binding cassette, subfamily C, bacterial LapB
LNNNQLTANVSEAYANEDVNINKSPDHELSLIKILSLHLRSHDIAFSDGAIRDLPETAYEKFGPIEVVNALSLLQFNASFGKIRFRKLLKLKFEGLICFDKNEEPFLLETANKQNSFIVTRYKEHQIASVEVTKAELKNTFNGYAIISEKKPPKSSKNEDSNWFFGSLLKSKFLYFQVIFAAAISNFLGLSTSLFIMVVYDRVIPNEATESLIALTIGVIVALIFDMAIKLLKAYFIDQAGRRADDRMSRLLFDKISQMDTKGQQKQSGALAGVVREFDTLREFFTSATLVAIVDLPFVFFFIWVISLIAGPLAAIPLLAVPIVIFTSLIIQPFLANIASNSMEQSFNKQGVLVETLQGLETIKVTGADKLMRKRYQTAATAQADAGVRSRFLAQFAINCSTSVQQFAQVATIFYGVYLIRDGEITMGALIAAVILGGRTLAPLTQMAQAMSRANSARQAYKNINNLFNNGTSHFSNVGNLSRSNILGSFEFQQASYCFPQSQTATISDLTLKIPAGQKVAIVGKMGSGKSTFLRLATGLVQPTSGSVLIDGIDLRQLNESDLRRNIGVMLQENWLFSGTVRENLQLGFNQYSDEDILKISKVAGLDDFISKVPNGYDLQLREKGEGLSGGQRQTIALARSLLHNPPVLVLDEPTSAMDTGTEKSVINRLSKWSKDKTILVVTHRKSILQIVDRVLVFDEGKIITDTTPDRL